MTTTARPSLARDARTLLAASRPVSWINTAFPFGAAYLFGRGEVDIVLVLGVLFFLIPYNLAMYGINDVFDYASDLANPRKGSIEGALLPPRLHRATLWASTITTVPFLAFLAWAGGPPSWPWLTLSAFAVVAYSAKGLRFKERPFLDSITSSTHFVSPAVVGFAVAAGVKAREAGEPAGLGLDLGTGTILLLTAFFLWGTAAHAFGAVQDVGPDRTAGIGSVATVIGARATVRLAIALWLAAGVLMLAVPWPGPLAAAVVVPYVLNAAPWWHVTDERAGQTNPAWRRFIWLNYASGFVVTMLLIWAWPG